MNLKSLFNNVYIKALIVWLVPFIVSFGFYNQDGQLATEFWVFKATMIVVASLTVLLVLINYFKNHSNWLQTSVKMLAVNVLLDLIVLVGLFKFDFFNWSAQVLPVYFVMIPLTCYLLYRSNHETSK